MRVYLIPSHQKKMSTTTLNQVSSPYAIYENETKIACIPYEILRVASQFVYKDYSKQLLMGIHLKVENEEMANLPKIEKITKMEIEDEKFEKSKKDKKVDKKAKKPKKRGRPPKNSKKTE